MDLKTFVTETLAQIVEGVGEAQNRITESGLAAAVNPGTVGPDSPRNYGTARPVEFDVAVVISEEASSASGEKAKASAGLISVVSLRAAGELESERSSGSRNETTSRIRFSVMLAQPGDTRRSQPVPIPTNRVV